MNLSQTKVTVNSKATAIPKPRVNFKATVNRKIGVLRFPGTNCDRDIWKSLELKDKKPHWIEYRETFHPLTFDAYIIPGGFSYGDYLRSGALAALSPAMESLKKAAEKGKPIFGICNGFQILCEAGLLPGALMKNESGRFQDQWVNLRLENKSQWSPFEERSYSMPMAHADGRYFINQETLKDLKANKQIWLTYKNNPNGSVADIAGVMNKKGNVVGMMPHPDRALFDWMGSVDGLQFFDWKAEGL